MVRNPFYVFTQICIYMINEKASWPILLFYTLNPLHLGCVMGNFQHRIVFVIYLKLFQFSQTEKIQFISFFFVELQHDYFNAWLSYFTIESLVLFIFHVMQKALNVIYVNKIHFHVNKIISLCNLWLAFTVSQPFQHQPKTIKITVFIYFCDEHKRTLIPVNFLHQQV